jgi:YfiH family protein
MRASGLDGQIARSAGKRTARYDPERIPLLLNFAHDVAFYTFPGLSRFSDLIHGVSTRQGGVSQPPFATLNLTWASGDDPLAVEENHRRLFAALGAPQDSMVSPRQVHSARVSRVGVQHRGGVVANCDALITNETEVALVLRFADCVPVLIYDPLQRAIGLAHAGWRGTVAGIAQATVRSMHSAFGSDPADLITGIGPAIGPCCYEIGPDVAAEVKAAFGPDTGLLKSVPPKVHTTRVGSASSPSTGPDDPHVTGHLDQSLYFDLWAANELLLRAAGVGHVDVAGLCTACHREEFFSYRAENGKVGHHGALLCLRG